MTAFVTVLDDYQEVSLESTDWSGVAAHFAVDVVSEHIADPDELVQRLERSDVVIAMRERTAFPASVLGRLPRLRLLVTTGMGNAAIDLDAARELGILVCGTGGAGNGVPELTLGMMIALTRHFVEEDRAVREGGWQHTIGPGLAGRTLGVVGLGRLGVPVARLAQAFQMEVVAWSPHLTAERSAGHGVRAVSRHELFSSADVVTIHMPLVSETRGLIGADDLGRMSPRSYLINTSRGPIVDEAALISALESGAIAGAALDVYDTEPLPLDHPLRSMPNTLLLPHIGYVTREAYEVFYRDAAEDIVAFVEGAPVRVLNG
jgi:phosphoglycerate dehydrogenase-like enzyme